MQAKVLHFIPLIKLQEIDLTVTEMTPGFKPFTVSPSLLEQSFLWIFFFFFLILVRPHFKADENRSDIVHSEFCCNVLNGLGARGRYIPFLHAK